MADLPFRFDERCAYCGTTQNLEGHHIVYRSHGGPDDSSNIITLCRYHHNIAQARPQWMLSVLTSLRRSEHWRWEESYQKLLRKYGA